MKLLVLTVLACVAGAMAQLSRPNLGAIGASVGGHIGNGVGGGIGSAFDTVLSIPGSILGLGRRPVEPIAPVVPSRPNVQPGYGSGSRPGYGAGPGSRPGYGPGAGSRPGYGPGASSRPGYGPGSATRPGNGSGSRNEERNNVRGTDSAARQGYEGQGSGGEYEKGGNYVREKTVSEREQGKSFDAGRGSQGSGRGGYEGRSDSYGKDSASSGSRYESRNKRATM